MRHVKSALIAVTLLFSVPIGGYPQAVNHAQGNIAPDGEYVGLKSMSNVSAEDPDGRDDRWFHENRLVIRNDEAILNMVPIYFHHGKKIYSASDGGFMTYRAKFMIVDGGNAIAMRMFDSDYIMVPLSKKDVLYTEIKVYPVNVHSGRIEFDGARYRRTALQKDDLGRLLKMLSAEPLDFLPPK